MNFRQVLAKDVHAPGFFLYMEPGNVFMGTDIWLPDSATLGKIREVMAANPKRWKRLTDAKALSASGCEMVGESLKRPPRCYDSEHPLIEDLKHKNFILTRTLDLEW